MNSSRNSLYYIIFTALFLALQYPAFAQSAKPNIIFIAIDDLRPDLGYYGNKIVRSPNIDKLAGSAYYFTNQFVQVPTCGASRHSLLTGRRPVSRAQLTNEIFELETSKMPESDNPESFIHLLKKNGYHTAGIGKISHSADGYVYGYRSQPGNVRELPYSWNELDFNPGKWNTGWNAFFGYADGENRQSVSGKVPPYEKADVNDTAYPDGLTAELAVDKIKTLARAQKPFFLGIGFFKPHLPFNSPSRYWDLYNEADMNLPISRSCPEGVSESSLHNSGEFNSYQLGEEHPSIKKQLSDSYAKKIKHAYYASVSYIDEQVGKVLKAVESNGLSNNTVIILWSDHGWHLGEHGIWGKHSLFDYSLKSPLIIKLPNQPGARIDAVVESVDIYPTIVQLCGLGAPDLLDGTSLLSLMKKEKDKDRAAYSYFKQGISVRTSRYRLTKYFRKEEPAIELFDYLTDPNETRNLANQNPEIVNKLMPLLEKGNTGLYK